MALILCGNEVRIYYHEKQSKSKFGDPAGGEKKRLSTDYTNFHELSVGEKDPFIDSGGFSAGRR